MVDRAFPLLVDILMALAAPFRIHEKIRGNYFAAGGSGRGGGEWRMRAQTLLVHRQWSGGRIHDAAIRVGMHAAP